MPQPAAQFPVDLTTAVESLVLAEFAARDVLDVLDMVAYATFLLAASAWECPGR